MWNPRPITAGIRYRAIVEQVRTAIQAGDLRPGDRLPTQRSLAAVLGVTISTVTQAYAEAARLHLVSGEVGRGTYVLSTSADATLFAATARRDGEHIGAEVDLTANSPAEDPQSTDLVTALGLLGRSGVVAEGYPSTAALLRGRLAMESLVETQGIDRRADEIVLTAGAQLGLLAALLVVAGPGARVLAEELTFPGLKAVARQLRIDLVPVRMDQHGILPADLQRQARRTSATTLVCVPVLQNPTGATMHAERRHDIAAVAQRHNLTVIEDDVYRALTHEACLASVLPEQTLLLTSVSKTIEPALRIGALVGPRQLLDAIGRETHLTSWAVSAPAIEVFAQWVHDGTAMRRIAWQRAEVLARWRLAERTLGRSPLVAAPHRFIGLTRSPDRAEEAARAVGVGVVSSSALGVGPHPPKGVRVSLTAARTRAVLADALARLAPVLANR